MTIGIGSTGRIQAARSTAVEDSVLPVVAAGQAEFVDMDHCVFDDREATFRFAPAPGHTLGNMMIGGHARARNLAIVTNNVREFARMPGLIVENWL